MCPFFWIRDFSCSSTEKSPKSLFLPNSLSAPELPPAQPSTPKWTVERLGDSCTHGLVLSQNLFTKEMEEIKRFTKSTQQKPEELEMALLNIFRKNNNKVKFIIIMRIPVTIRDFKESHIQFSLKFLNR